MGGTSKSKLIKAWFFLDILLLLFPPLHWRVSRHQDVIAGVPISLIYFIATSIFVAASVIYAYVKESNRE